NGTDLRASLVSNLDPNLLDLISRYGERPSAEIPGRLSDDRAAQTLAESQPRSADDQKAVRPSMRAGEDPSKRDLPSLADSERSSVHLYNMRISQRLASPSFVTASTRLNTSHATT